jgi:hypothetical protein
MDVLFAKFAPNQNWTKIEDDGINTIWKVSIYNFLEQTRQVEMTSVDELNYKSNRIRDNDRVKRMVEQQIESYQTSGRFKHNGSQLNMGHINNECKYVVLDGQHRLATYEQLWADSLYKEALRNGKYYFIVRVSYVAKYEDLHTIFKEINDNFQPVSKYYTDTGLKKILDLLGRHIKKNVSPVLLSDSSKPHRPHINITALLDHIALNEKTMSFISDEMERGVDHEVIAERLWKIIQRFSDENRDITRFYSFSRGQDAVVVRKAHEKVSTLGSGHIYIGMFNSYNWLSDMKMEPPQEPALRQPERKPIIINKRPKN